MGHDAGRQSRHRLHKHPPELLQQTEKGEVAGSTRASTGQGQVPRAGHSLAGEKDGMQASPLPVLLPLPSAAQEKLEG